MSNKKMDGKNMINFYKLDKVKKYLPKDDDEQYQFTGCKIFKHILFVAPTGGGKTNALMNYIALTSEPKKVLLTIYFYVMKQMKFYMNF
jgi:superfamily II DNA or RNA helicase